MPHSVPHLTNFSFEFFYRLSEDASQLRLYDSARAKKSEMTKNSNQGGGPALR